jgi:hypothetical protein
VAAVDEKMMTPAHQPDGRRLLRQRAQGALSRQEARPCRRTKRRLAGIAEAHGVDLEAAELLAAREELTKMVPIGKWGDKWFKHPVSDMREPEKSVCWLTDVDAIETDPVKREHQVSHHARLHLKAHRRTPRTKAKISPAFGPT